MFVVGSAQSNPSLNISHVTILFRCTLAYLYPLEVFIIGDHEC